MAAPTKPGHFLTAILFYSLTWIVVSYVFNLLGHRFGWSLWANKQFSLGETIVTGIVWSVAMVACNFWRSQKREFS
jgi:Zn-dependent protease with chaperone function